MATPLKFASLLLLSSALTAPAAFAQNNDTAPGGAAAPGVPSSAQTSGENAGQGPATGDQEAAQTPDVSVPGGEIVVTGRRTANIEKSATSVVSVLSSEAIARTGEGNIAGALGRVTGLSVVGNGFVYVRGLGDRYSMALLNGSPLPSPEPLKRSIPLDLFPTDIVASSLVQKSYSVNFPGEFGGGVVNLTTTAVPTKSFLKIGGGIGVNTETTSSMGYVYRGAGSDWTGFDNGRRNTPSALADYFASGLNTSQISDEENRAIASSLVTPQLSVIQRWGHVAPNFSGDVSGGTSFDLGGATLGLIATAGYSNRWQTRDSTQQFSSQDNLGLLDSNFERVTTTDRVVANGLLGLGLEFGDSKIRTTSLYIRDTLKSTRLGVGTRQPGTATFQVQDTAWYERQLIDNQIVGEFKPMTDVTLDLRAGYANSQREAPAESTFEYYRTNNSDDPFGSLYQISLTGNVGNRPRIAWSDLNEDLWSGGADLGFHATPDITLTAGYAYQLTRRRTSRREFQLSADNSTPTGVLLLRPDVLFSPGIINGSDGQGGVNPFGITAEEVEPNPVFDSRLINHAGYGKAAWQITSDVLIDAGVRYEWARQSVARVPVYASDVSTFATQIKKHYWLPAGTITWSFQPDMQIRVNASKTIARPQFRELVFQPYFDPDTNRTYKGNPYLTDSELFNAEARYEWYFGRDQHLSVAGFYKRIDNPIEAYLSLDSSGTSVTTFYANAPKADLYGAEVELQKYVDASSVVSGAFFDTRRVLLLGNYTYTKSKLKVTDQDTTIGANGVVTGALAYFRDGSPMTGQSDHLANLQFGLEDQNSLSQQTFILSYASKRVTSRGVTRGVNGQPDVYEYPGFNLDFVVRQGVMVKNHQIELKFEARNITDRKYKEYQQYGSAKVYYNLYNPGTTVNFSVSTSF